MIDIFWNQLWSKQINSPGETTSGALCPVLGSSLLEKHGTNGDNLMKGYKENQGMGSSLWVEKTEGAGSVQGEEKGSGEILSVFLWAVLRPVASRVKEENLTGSEVLAGMQVMFLFGQGWTLPTLTMRTTLLPFCLFGASMDITCQLWILSVFAVLMDKFFCTKEKQQITKRGQKTYGKHEDGNFTGKQNKTKQWVNCLYCSCHEKTAQNYKADLV